MGMCCIALLPNKLTIAAWGGATVFGGIMSVRLCGLLLAGCSIVWSGTAMATTDAPVTQALALQQQGKAAQAYALLLPDVAARAGDPDFDYAFGLAAADSRHFGDAIAAFQRVIAVQPDNAQARAEIARVYALAGDIDTAKAQFDTVVDDPTVPDPVRQRIGKLVRDYDRAIRGGADRLTGYIDAEGGYDGNINTATNATSITLPVFAFLGPASLSGTARRTDDAYYQIQGGLSGSTALSRQTRLYLSGLGSWRDNLDSKRFDQASLTGTLGIVHGMASGDAVSLSGQAQQYWLGHDGYRASFGAIGQYTHRLNSGAALAVQAQYYRLDYADDPLRDANRYALTVNYSGQRWYGGIGGGREDTVRHGADHLGYGFASAQAGTEYPLSAFVALLVGAAAEYRDYEGSDPLFLKGRHDTQLDGTLGLRFALGHGLSLRPRVTYTRNFSNIDLYDYARFTAGLGLRAEF
jgi:tetratricopeptide (TPR) repeat protein